jgi:hypothetical protein
MLATFIRDPNAGEMMKDSVRFWDVRSELQPGVQVVVAEIDETVFNLLIGWDLEQAQRLITSTINRIFH